MGLRDQAVAQSAVIGSMLVDNKCIGPTLHQISAKDFAWPAYRTLYFAIRDLFSRDLPVDVVTLTAAAREAEPDRDWAKLIAEIQYVTVTAANVDAYIPILKADGQWARLQELFARGAEAQELDDQLEIIRTLNGELVDNRRDAAVGMEDALQEWMDRMKTKPEYLTFGFPKLDRRLYVEPGDFVILGGRPSAGKTALGLQIAYGMADKRRVAFYSLETNPKKLQDRLLARVAGIPLGRMKDRQLTEEDYGTVATMSSGIIRHQLKYQKAAGWSADDILDDARSHRYDVIVIDYVQLITLPPRTRDRVQGMTDVSMALHRGAQSSGITILGLSQLSRPDKGQVNPKAPTMRDLRETGQWEQDADAVLLLYLEKENDRKGRRVLDVVKNKEGKVGRVYMSFDGPTQTFGEHLNQTVPKKKKKEPEYKQTTFTELQGHDPDCPFEEERYEH